MCPFWADFSSSGDPIALLTEDVIKSTSSETRVEAVKKLRTVALAMGNQRVRKELIPFIKGAPRIYDFRRARPFSVNYARIRKRPVAHSWRCRHHGLRRRGPPCPRGGVGPVC